jgi:tRNA pseudouridine38-40 synthase
VTRYRATLAYDGSAYQGFQRQVDGVPTVQAAVEDAIARIVQRNVTILAAGRTDAGVHAVGQVIAFDVDWRHATADLLRAINAVLPDDIALQDIRQHADFFHPRYDALSRVYYYRVLNAEQPQPLLRKLCWQIRGDLNVNIMQDAAEMLIGTHDFAAFGNPPQGENTIREVMMSRWTRENQPFGDFLVYRLEGTAFLQHMVRRIVGMLTDVGRGALTLAQFEAIFQSADLSQATTLAPPQGLTLEKVRYHD